MPAAGAPGTAVEAAGTAGAAAGMTGRALAARMGPALPEAEQTQLADLAAAVLADSRTAAAPVSA